MGVKMEALLLGLGLAVVYIGAAIFGAVTGNFVGRFFKGKWRDHPRSI